MDIEKNYINFSAYFSGDLNDEELKQLEQTIRSDKESERQFELAQKIWNNTNYPEKERKLRISQITFNKIDQAKRKSRQLKIFYYAAAVLVIAFAIPTLIWFGNNEPEELISEYAASGEIKNFKLEDGTIVWLNAQSSLQFPEKFSKKNRKVILDGEAYFDVESDKNHPFIVQTNSISIQVTGTRFNVSAYKNDPQVTTFLEEGIVSVTNKKDQNSYDLNPGHVLELNKKSEDITILKADMKYLTSWRTGELSFYNESFESICRKLERKFGVEIILENAHLKDLKYSAEFDKEGINDILEILNSARTMEVRIEGHKFYISERNS